MLFRFGHGNTLKLSHFYYSTQCFRSSAPATLPNLKPLNSQISSYMKNGYIYEARKLFDEMPQRNTVTWNAMIRGYFQNGHFDEAVWLYNQMPHHDIYLYNTMIAGLMQCGNVSGEKEAKEV